MWKVALAVVSVLAVGCSTPAPEQKEPLGPPPTQMKFDPVAYSARYEHPLQCEAMAEQLQPRSRDHAWQALQACVSHGNFRALRALLSPQWLPDLRTRPEAPGLVTDVIAARGGNVESDLHLLYGQRIPLFTLAAGFGQPDIYVGRLVLVRARVNSIRKVGHALVADVSEVTLQSESKAPRQIGASLDSHSDQSYSQQDANGHWNGTDVNEEDDSTSVTVPVYDNVSVDTGRDALVTLEHPDPFFETGGEYLMLARFDGLKPPAPREDQPTARLTLVHFQRPGALVVN